MSSSAERASWIDRWWTLLVILFGIGFVTFLMSFSPKM